MGKITNGKWENYNDMLLFLKNPNSDESLLQYVFINQIYTLPISLSEWLREIYK